MLIGNGSVLNSPVALDPSPDIINDWCKNQRTSEEQISSPCHQVVTRSSSRNSLAGKPLSSNSLNCTTSHSELASLQHKDPSFVKGFDPIGGSLKTPRLSKGTSKYSFGLRNCILVRMFLYAGLLLSVPVYKFYGFSESPFGIAQVVPNSDVNYVVRVNGMDKTFYVDMLQEFVHRPAELIPETIDMNAKEGKEQTDEPLQVSAAVVMSASSLALINSFSPAFASMIHEEHDSVEIEDTSGLTKLIMPSLKQKETICDTQTYSKLDPGQITEVENLLEIFSEIFSDVPSKTECITHKIKLSSSDPVRRKPYPLPFTSEQIVRDEISSMIDNDIIEPSDSPYSSPIVFFIVNFYAKFILHISDLLLPLYELTKKDQPEQVIWTEQCQRFLEKNPGSDKLWAGPCYSKC